MRIYHLADLHFGKFVYGLSMLADQRHFVEEFLKICQQRQPDAVLIAGDVYDRSAPSGDAVELLDFLLTKLVEQEIPVLLISGSSEEAFRYCQVCRYLCRHRHGFGFLAGGSYGHPGRHVPLLAVGYYIYCHHHALHLGSFDGAGLD